MLPLVWNMILYTASIGNSITFISFETFQIMNLLTTMSTSVNHLFALKSFNTRTKKCINHILQREWINIIQVTCIMSALVPLINFYFLRWVCLYDEYQFWRRQTQKVTIYCVQQTLEPLFGCQSFFHVQLISFLLYLAPPL